MVGDSTSQYNSKTKDQSSQQKGVDSRNNLNKRALTNSVVRTKVISPPRALQRDLDRNAFKG